MIFEKNPEADSALRRATEFKNAGRMDEAIAELIKFRRLAEAGKVNYTVAAFLRLPLYLQAASRRDEAWEEFYRLLKVGYPNQLNDHSVWLAEKALVYDKMRLFLQRDDNNLLAVHFGLLSYANHLAALALQERLQELALARSPEKMDETIDELLKKAKRPDLRTLAAEALNRFIRNGFALDAFESEARQIFCAS